MNCKNCKTTLTPDATFCYCCGAKVIKNRLTIKNLLIHISETFFNYDNKFLQTTINLFTNPKDVIDTYVNGVRKKYVEPLTFFAISITISGLYLLFMKKYFPDFFAMTEIYDDDNAKLIGEKLVEILIEYNTLFNILYIPIISIMSKVVFFNKHYNFTEHLVIYFYTMSLFTITSSILTSILVFINPNYFSTVVVFLYPGFFVYMCYVLTKIFNLSIKQLVLKILLLIPLIFIVYFIFTILMVVTLITTGTLTLQDFQPPS